ncbi:MAG: type II toxin-antitoxin system HicA family toxin [Prevotellaceae bacterium]|jgi:predicted RNA binding protein YcfA (HicA-like mRNA interferase family)|nr:type II toxin-antitoxin system HicA family toxin [Prevotellaceae bacterium]
MKYSKLIQVLHHHGWEITGQRGSHLKMRHPLRENALIVPNHGTKEIGKGLAIKILKSAGIIE